MPIKLLIAVVASDSLTTSGNATLGPTVMDLTSDMGGLASADGR